MGLIVVFELDAQRFGLPLAVVERAVRAVALTALPNAPAVVIGAINVQGQVLGVVDLRKKLKLPSRELRLSDQLLVVRTARRSLALLVDAVVTVSEYATDDFIAAAALVPGLEDLSGIVKLDDGIILVHQLDQMLSLEQASQLERAILDA